MLFLPLTGLSFARPGPYYNAIKAIKQQLFKVVLIILNGMAAFPAAAPDSKNARPGLIPERAF